MHGRIRRVFVTRISQAIVIVHRRCDPFSHVMDTASAVFWLLEHGGIQQIYECIDKGTSCMPPQTSLFEPDPRYQGFTPQAKKPMTMTRNFGWRSRQWGGPCLRWGLDGITKLSEAGTSFWFLLAFPDLHKKDKRKNGGGPPDYHNQVQV
jgi:hypothetical protein